MLFFKHHQLFLELILDSFFVTACQIGWGSADASSNESMMIKLDSLTDKFTGRFINLLDL